MDRWTLKNDLSTEKSSILGGMDIEEQDYPHLI